MIGKFLIFYAAMACYLRDARGVLLCEINPIPPSPNSCSNFTDANYADSGRIYECSGGSPVTEFEVRAGCSPVAGSGAWDNPIIQTPSPISYASDRNAGPYCYCQIKSINGGSSFAPSPRWVYVVQSVSAHNCSYLCLLECVNGVRSNSLLRSTLFNALQ